MSNAFWEVSAAPILLIVAGIVVYVCIDLLAAGFRAGREERRRLRLLKRAGPRR